MKPRRYEDGRYVIRGTARVMINRRASVTISPTLPASGHMPFAGHRDTRTRPIGERGLRKAAKARPVANEWGFERG